MNGLDWTLVARYLEGTCTPEQREALERWASEDPSHRAELDELQRTWTRAGQLPSSRRIDAMWNELATRMRLPSLDIVRGAEQQNARERVRKSTPHILPLEHRRRASFRRIGAIAAALLVAISVGVWQLRTSASSDRHADVPAFREYTTTRGQRATIQLADGSQLTLAAESRIRIPEDFGKVVREISLDGEALLDVVHDTNRPFRVHVKDAIAEDIGTRFDIRSYSLDSTVAVVVEEGAVALGKRSTEFNSSANRVDSRHGAPEGVVLHRGDIGTIGREGRVTTRSTSHPELYSSWTHGKLEFVRTPLTEVAQTIGRWYDLNIHIEGESLSARSVTATFSVQSPAEMLQILALAVNARVERRGPFVRLVSNR